MHPLPYKKRLQWVAPPLVVPKVLVLHLHSKVLSLWPFEYGCQLVFKSATAVAQTAAFPSGPPNMMKRKQQKARERRFVAWVQTSQRCYSNECLSAGVCAERASLTLHSAQNEWFDAVKFHIRCQVEVLSGVLVDLKDNVYHICEAGRKQRLMPALICQGRLSVLSVKLLSGETSTNGGRQASN